MGIRRARNVSKEIRSIHSVITLAHQQNKRKKIHFSTAKITRKKIKRHVVKNIFFVYILRGRLVGTVCLKKRKNDIEIMLLSVHPAYQSEGIGSKLLRHAERHARVLSYSSCILYTIEDHPWLPIYYRSRGYRKVSTNKGVRHRISKYHKRV